MVRGLNVGLFRGFEYFTIKTNKPLRYINVLMVFDNINKMKR